MSPGLVANFEAETPNEATYADYADFMIEQNFADIKKIE